MAKRVSPRNMNREIAWLCPSVLECGSSVSGSLAVMLRIFFCASAGGGAMRPTTPSAETSTSNTNKQSRRGCAMDFSSFGGRATGTRDARPGRTLEVFEDRHAERDSSMTTSVESVQDGSEGPIKATRPCLEKLAAKIHAARTGYKRVNPNTRLVVGESGDGPFQGRAESGIGKSKSGAYCCAPNTSRSPGLPLGRSRRIVNLIASAGSNSTNSVRRSREMA